MSQMYEKLGLTRENNKYIESSNKELKIVFMIMLIPIITSINFFAQNSYDVQTVPIKTGYVIQNLRGDAMYTWVAWNVVEGRELQIQIINEADVSTEKLEAVRNAILSTKKLEIDDSLTHKGPEGSSSTYYEGWKGALDTAAQQKTSLNIPTEFTVVDSKKGIADIRIILTPLISGDGYSGFTKSITNENHILMSQITIFEADKLSARELETIVRHEFGHALGLAHSEAPEDLMAPTIQTAYPYISECNVEALQALYDGNKQSHVICEK